jgi:hypothetical protein
MTLKGFNMSCTSPAAGSGALLPLENETSYESLADTRSVLTTILIESRLAARRPALVSSTTTEVTALPTPDFII